MIALLLVFLVIILFIFLYISMQWRRHICDIYGIRYVTPYPFVGNFGQLIFHKSHVMDILKSCYEAFPNDRFVAVFELSNPVMLIRDPDLIRDVTVKDFSHFENHKLEMDAGYNIFGNSLPCLRSQAWKEMRATISPVFTSSKMRNMFGFMNTCSKNMTAYYLKLNTKGNSIIEVEATDLFYRFANDVIASTAFGVEIDSFVEPNNEFFRMGMLAAVISSIRLIFYLSLPKVMKLLKVPFTSRKASTFFTAVVKHGIEEREKTNIYRPDLIHLLNQARKGKLKNEGLEETDFFKADHTYTDTSTKKSWSVIELTAQALFFYIAGADASMTTASFLLNTLAFKPHIQKKLQKEIDETRTQYNDELNYDILIKMKYLDMVVCEALRQWTTSGGSSERLCTRDYTFPPTRDGVTKQYTIRKGESIYISAASLHYDPKYWENPQEFIPERFSEENKHKIKPFTYFPFGTGPRNCLGSRYALMLLKLWIFHILANFDIVRCDKTKENLKYDPWNFTIRVNGGIWIGIKPRSKVDTVTYAAID